MVNIQHFPLAEDAERTASDKKCIADLTTEMRIKKGWCNGPFRIFVGNLMINPDDVEAAYEPIPEGSSVTIIDDEG